jgi:hypothetical protein
MNPGVTHEDIDARLKAGSERFISIEETLHAILAKIECLPALQADVAAMKPQVEKSTEILEVMAAVKTAGKFIRWLAGVIAAIGVIVASWKFGVEHVAK